MSSTENFNFIHSIQSCVQYIFLVTNKQTKNLLDWLRSQTGFRGVLSFQLVRLGDQLKPAATNISEVNTQKQHLYSKMDRSLLSVNYILYIIIALPAYGSVSDFIGKSQSPDRDRTNILHKTNILQNGPFSFSTYTCRCFLMRGKQLYRSDAI